MRLRPLIALLLLAGCAEKPEVVELPQPRPEVWVDFSPFMKEPTVGQACRTFAYLPAERAMSISCPDAFDACSSTPDPVDKRMRYVEGCVTIEGKRKVRAKNMLSLHDRSSDSAFEALTIAPADADGPMNLREFAVYCPSPARPCIDGSPCPCSEEAP